MVALVSTLAATALFALRPGCEPPGVEASQRALDPERHVVSATGAGAAPTTLAPAMRRTAGTPQDSEQRASSIAGIAPGAAPNVEAPHAGGAGAPPCVITLEVVHARGSPVPQAKVSIERLWFRPSAAPSGLDSFELTADAQGRVRFDCLVELGAGFGGPLPAQVGLACTATDGVGGASPELVLAPPVGLGPHTLILGAAAAVTVEVVEGSPPRAVAGADVHLDLNGRDSQRAVRTTTDERGLARLRGLSPGTWSYYVQPQGGEHNVRGQLELVPGEDRALTVVLDEGVEALAVAGRFVDEEGATIEVGRDDHPKLWVGANMTEFGTATAPSADGTFRVYLQRSANVVVRNFGGHRYEPALAQVPFGTQDLVLRRVERFPARTIVVEGRDAADGGRITGLQLTVYEDDARSAMGMSLVTRPSPSRVQATVRARPGTRLAVWAEHYAPQFLDLPPSGATAEAPLVVSLERGGPRELYVLDAATLQPIAGVELVATDGSPLAATDGAGRAQFRVDHGDWLTLRHAGHSSSRFHPTWPWDRSYLVRE